MKTFSMLRSFAGKRSKQLALGSVFVVITNLLQVLLPSFIGRAVDLLGGTFQLRALFSICGLILGVELFKGITRFLMRYITISASWEIENDLRVRLFRHLLTLPVTFFDRTRTGDIIARLTNDLTAVRMMFGPAVMYTVNAVVLLPLAIGFMLWQDPVLTFYAVIPFPFIAATMYRVGHRIHRDFLRVQESYSDMSAHIQEDLNGIQVVKAYVRERSELGKLRSLSRTYVGHNQRVIRMQSIMFPMLDVFSSAGVILLLWIGGRRVIAGEVTLGTVAALVMYIGLLVWPSIALGWVTAMFQRGVASAYRIQEFFDETPEPSLPQAVGERLQGGIDVRDLSFAFANGTPVLRNLSFSVRPGTTLGIVGRTGAGKSTLLGVLSGIYTVESGQIFYDGVEINDLPLEKLRGSIALTPQDTFLFSESVRDNIAIGAEQPGSEAVEFAARLAAVADDIADFPEGYDTMLGERGITVSGGQRQRITIARSLISDSPIVFFDDCLSNVDTATERTILNNIAREVENRTALIVTQRLAAIKHADLILYLADGCITERGTHAELMALDGDYAVLYREQELIEALEDTDKS